MELTLGEMLFRIMKDEGIRQRDLCRGLCTAAALHQFRGGQRHPDWLLAAALLQRLGKSPDKFVFLLTERERAYFRWRQETELARLEGDWTVLEELLQRPEAEDGSCLRCLQRQYVLMMGGMVQEKCHGNRTGGLALLEEAVLLTVPDFPAGGREEADGEPGFGALSRARLSAQEIEAMLLWQELQPDGERGFRLLEALLKNVDANYTDRQEKCRLYPRLAARYLPVLNERRRSYDCVAMARRALELVAETGYAGELPRILRAYAESAKVLKSAGYAELRERAETWRRLWVECGAVSEEGVRLPLFSVSREVELVSELLFKTRRERGYTQQRLCEGICDAVTLSKIENGKRSPSRKTYRKLAGRLSLSGEPVRGEIVAESFKTLELRWEFEIQIDCGEWRRAEDILRRLEEELDGSEPRNRQYRELAEYILDRCTGRTKPEEEFGRLRRILSYSVPKMPAGGRADRWPERFWSRAFTGVELSALLQLSDVFSAAGDLRQAVFLSGKILEICGGDKAGAEGRYRTALLAMGRLAAQYNCLTAHEKALECAEEGIRISLRRGTCKQLPVFLNNKAFALESLGDKEEGRRWYKMACSAAEAVWNESYEAAAQAYKRLKSRVSLYLSE